MSAIECCFFKATLFMFSYLERRQSQCGVRAGMGRATDAVALRQHFLRGSIASYLIDMKDDSVFDVLHAAYAKRLSVTSIATISKNFMISRTD